MLKCIFHTLIFSFIFIITSYSNEIKITSDELEIDRLNKLSIFKGNVYVYDNDLEIWSEKLIMNYNNSNKIQELLAEKNVKIKKEGIWARGDKGIYYPNIEALEIFGSVEVRENNNLVKCDELFLDIKNSTSIMSSKSSGRVEAYIVNN